MSFFILWLVNYLICFVRHLLENPLKLRFCLTAMLASSFFLSGCGGGDSAPIKKPTITSVTTDQLVYRKNTTMTITGKDLDLGFNMSHLGCLKITEVPGGTTTQRVFSCKMVGAGTVAVNITAADGSNIYAGTMTIPLAAQPQVTMVTSLGTVVLELNPAKAPVTVDNFLQYVESSFYVNKIFHRVISDFMVQGGGFLSNLSQPATLAPIKLESGNGLSNLRGTVAMARTSVVDSATSQFYINVVDNLFLDGTAGVSGYAVFGKVVSGLDIVDKIKVVPTSKQAGMDDVPVTPVVITSVLQTQ